MVPVVSMMPAMRPVKADAARTVMGQDDAATAIGMIVIGRHRVVGSGVVGPKVPMMVMREPVTAELISATVNPRGAEPAALEGRCGAEAAIMKAAATKMGAASTVTAAAEMHPAATVATSAKVSAASATMTSTTMTSTPVAATHLRGQALRDLLGYGGSARIDQ